MPTYQCPLVGAFYRPPAQAILKVLPSACPLLVQPEPENPHDPNAIAIWVATTSIPEAAYGPLEETAGGFGFSLDDILAALSWHLGYIAKEYAAALVDMVNSEATTRATLSFDTKGKPQVLLEITL